MDDLLADLAAEHAELDAMVAGLDAAGLDTPTPAEGWSIRDQLTHIAFFDDQALVSITDPDRFMAELNAGLEAEGFSYLDAHIDRGREMTPADLLDWFRTARRDLLAGFRTVDPEARVPWYGPPMKARSSAVARLMETWAHGQDVADALGVTRSPTDRLFHIAELGVKTFRFAFENRGLEVPGERVRVALRGVGGTTKVWNDEFDSSITGPVEEFCLVVAQRRHIDDTHLVLEGELAHRWMEVAQIFAGPPTPGRAPERGEA